MVYAKQTPPEYQESPLFFDESWPENVICCGNRQLRKHSTEAYDIISDHLSECANEIKSIGKHTWPYRNATEAITDLLPPEHKQRYATREIKAWKELLQKYESCRSWEESKYIAKALSLITGMQYEYAEIHGCVQGEWQQIYYPAEYGDDFLRGFEIEYFNLGSEWIIHDEPEVPMEPEDIIGYTTYLHASGYDPTEVRTELSNITGEKAENIVLFSFDGWCHLPCYLEI